MSLDSTKEITLVTPKLWENDGEKTDFTQNFIKTLIFLPSGDVFKSKEGKIGGKWGSPTSMAVAVVYMFVMAAIALFVQKWKQLFNFAVKPVRG
jgi:hypothetical protein